MTQQELLICDYSVSPDDLCEGSIERRRQYTRYVEEESNFVVCCEKHFKEIQAYWIERWAEYYSDCF